MHYIAMSIEVKMFWIYFCRLWNRFFCSWSTIQCQQKYFSCKSCASI